MAIDSKVGNYSLTKGEIRGIEKDLYKVCIEKLGFSEKDAKETAETMTEGFVKPDISIVFKDYKNKDNAVNELLEEEYKLKSVGFKCILVTKRGEEYLRDRGYKFERVDINKYFSKKNLINMQKSLMNILKRNISNSSLSSTPSPTARSLIGHS